MVNKGPNWFGVAAMCAIYWGALYYWIKTMRAPAKYDMQENRKANITYILQPYPT